MTLNKIFAAILFAGIVAMLSGFVADKAIHAEDLETDAVKIAGKAAPSNHGATNADIGAEESVLPLLASADVERGAKLSKVCAACHSFDNGGPVKQGPNLWEIVNKDKGSIDGFKYSKALAEKEGVWDYESLDAFLKKPKKYIKKTKMTYAGMKKIEDRAAMIAWLRTLSDSPADLPAADGEQEGEPTEEAPAE
jgi:cytochrome c